MPKHSHAHFFDLDYTLLNANSGFAFARFLYRRGFYTRKQIWWTYYYALRFELGCVCLPSLHARVFNRLLLGCSFKEVEAHAKDFMKIKLKNKLYPPAYERLLKAKELGHYTAIVSSAPQFFVSLIAKKLGIDTSYASRYLVDRNGNFCAVGKVVEGQQKCRFVQKTARNIGLPIEETTAYSDSILDLSFLRGVGRAVAVKPDSRLRKVCMREKWEIVP